MPPRAKVKPQSMADQCQPLGRMVGTKELRRSLEKKPLRSSCAAAPFSLRFTLPPPGFLGPHTITSLRTFTGFSSGRNRWVSASGSMPGVLLEEISRNSSSIFDSRAFQDSDGTVLIRKSGAQSFKNFCISLADSAITGPGEASGSAMVSKKIEFC